MTRRVPLLLVFALAIGATLTGASARAQAQTFTGKWVHEGRRGLSTLEFFPGEKRIVGPTRGQFHHMLVLDDGRIIQGDGYYVYRSVLPNRGWLTLHFADGHVTREHEHTVNSTGLQLEHHGMTWIYFRQQSQ